MSKKKKLGKVEFLLLVLICVSFFLYTQIFYSVKPKKFVKNYTSEDRKTLFFVYKITRYPTFGNVTELKIENKTISIGVATEPTQLNFGLIPANFTVRKIITIKNYENVPVKVKMKVFGDIKDFISFSRNDFILLPNEETKIYITFNATKLGNYTGEIDVIVKKPRSTILLPLLKMV